MHLKLLQKEQLKKLKKQLEIWVGNKIADRIAKASKLVTNEEENIGLEREIHTEIYISPEQIPKIIDDLRLI